MGLSLFLRSIIPFAIAGAITFYLTSDSKQKKIIKSVSESSYKPKNSSTSIHSQNFKTILTQKYNPAVKEAKK